MQVGELYLGAARQIIVGVMPDKFLLRAALITRVTQRYAMVFKTCKHSTVTRPTGCFDLTLLFGWSE